MVEGIVTFVALFCSVLALFSSRRRTGWILAPLAAGVLVAAGVVSGPLARAGVRPLLDPLAFVLFAVPMAVLLDRFGLFEVLARRAARRGVLGRLWVLAAAVTALLNLDAAVVLLTPLYVDIARREHLSPFALGLQPALLSGLASLPLPYSNLTNLVVAARVHASAADFLVHLGPSALGATAAGWCCYRFRLAAIVAAGPDETRRPAATRAADAHRRDERRVLALGGGLAAAVVAGFIVVPALGGELWQVAAAADLVLVLLVRALPLRSVPATSALTILGLAVLVAGVASHLNLAAAVSGSSALDLVRTTAVETGLSDAVNNLPAVLVSAPLLAHDPRAPGAYAVLVGTNVGSLLVPTGSLALLLWTSLMNRLGVAVTPRHLLAVLWQVALAGLVAATALCVLVAVLV